ncbi:MAG TPA: DUF488 domain-containing protein [Gammaproteobacteria bacterium]|nr:DUF488 domain-containing protein [Gammaproteobacteria bacterium]
MSAKQTTGGANGPKTTVYTLGHSTRPIEEFIALLRRHGIELLVDIRTVPGSRRNPQFGQQSLEQSLAAAGIGYRHMKSLGGLRRTSTQSVNLGWRNASFRGFADYMQTPEFAAAVDELVELARGARVAIMCAEAVPWRCHRSLVGDALLVRGVEVVDVIGEASSRAHTLTPFAKVEGTAITYPAAT